RHLDRVDDPERLVLRARLLQEAAQTGLAVVGGLLELVDDEPAALVPVADLRDLAEIGLFLQDDPERRLAVGVDLVDDLLCDLLARRSRRRCRRGIGRGTSCDCENRHQNHRAQRPADIRPTPAVWVHPEPLSFAADGTHGHGRSNAAVTVGRTYGRSRGAIHSATTAFALRFPPYGE